MEHLEPDLDGTIRPTERTEYAERVIDPGRLEYERRHLVRDVNGRWRPIEARQGEVRVTGASERTSDETVRRSDLNGTLAVDERRVTRRFAANGREDEVIETYAPYPDGMARLALSQRMHRTTTPTGDGGSYTVEEVEQRSRVAPSDPMRVSLRTVTSVRQTSPGRWVAERQVFERDINGRMRLVSGFPMARRTVAGMLTSTHDG